MTQKLLLFVALLLPLPAFALRVDNCDDTAHQAQVLYNGATVEFELAPGQSRYFAGIPLEVRVGTDHHFDLRQNDEWCIWGQNDVHLQRRLHTNGRTGG